MRGSEKLLSIWWFLVLVFVGVCIVVGVFFFYQGEDVREMHAALLAERLASCASQEVQKISQNTLSLEKDCYLSQEAFAGGSFYGRIAVPGKAYEIGNKALEADCKVARGIAEKGKYPSSYPYCILREEQVVINGKAEKIEIAAVSNSRGGRI